MYDADKARARRIKLNLTVDQLADRAGISPASVYRYENGDRTPTVDTFVRIANALRISSSSLVRQAEEAGELPALFRAEMTRRKDPTARVISTHADAVQAVRVDELVSGIRRVQRDTGKAT
ncbi:helix-turn-helix domain-containing protein [Streptomyces sp. x-19]|uniref:helix-turn-helix domain-containing protein n=1 Tax=Streptomyces sp. x-19 TaxID=2789280 RepID=UPI0039802269